MAKLTVTNISNEVLKLQDLYVTLQPGASITTERVFPDLWKMCCCCELLEAGKVTMSLELNAWEWLLRNEQTTFQGGVALSSAVRKLPAPLITPELAKSPAGKEPSAKVYNTLMVLEFLVDNDAAYRIYKIPYTFVSDPTFHIHWTKSSDANEQGHTVKWQITYCVFDGSTDDAADGSVTVSYQDTYEDDGTTTRIVHRTADIPITGFVAGKYVSVRIEAITPSGTALTTDPALVALDLEMVQYINMGDRDIGP